MNTFEKFKELRDRREKACSMYRTYARSWNKQRDIVNLALKEMRKITIDAGVEGMVAELDLMKRILTDCHAKVHNDQVILDDEVKSVDYEEQRCYNLLDSIFGHKHN